jgi:hypothetical protein
VSPWRWILCTVFGEHDWTSMVEQNLDADGKPVVPEDLRPRDGDGPILIRKKFAAYARMYCRHCGRPSRFQL